MQDKKTWPSQDLVVLAIAGLLLAACLYNVFQTWRVYVVLY